MAANKQCCSERPAPGRVVVLEGMPGSGKTTAALALAAAGGHVIGEYVAADGTTLVQAAHPRLGDDGGHLRNWLIKQGLVAKARRGGTVYCDRDWLSALAYAASLGVDAGLLRNRCAWASEMVASGGLAVADDYVVFGPEPDTSLARRAARLVPGHPWSDPAGLRRLAAFYNDPLRAIGDHDPDLAARLASARWHHLSGLRPGEAVPFLLALAADAVPAGGA